MLIYNSAGPKEEREVCLGRLTHYYSFPRPLCTNTDFKGIINYDKAAQTPDDDMNGSGFLT